MRAQSELPYLPKPADSKKTAPTATWSSRVIVNHQSKLNRRSTSVHLIGLIIIIHKKAWLFGDTYTSIHSP